MIEKQVSKGIIKTYFDKLQRNLDLDVAIVVAVLRASWLPIT
jgi:thiamine thiazole synthase